MKDFYYILATDVNCTFTEIKEAYENLLKKHRPYLDQNDHYFETQFMEIREAYEVLSDPAKRKQYDKELEEIKSNPIIQIPKKQSYHSKTKVIDIAFSIILIFTTLIFVNYVIKSMSSSKANKVSKAHVVSTVSIVKTKHRKKKHFSKSIAITNQPKIVVKSDSIKTLSVVQVPVHVSTISSGKIVSSYEKNISKKTISSNILENDKKTNNNENYLYASYIKSNETGTINMRKFDNYSSIIIKTIPNNSKVFVLEKGNNYYKVMFDNITGYIPKWTILTK